ncbi:hypothetical protein SAMN05216223_110246 [Actinacidiphila yanglinensis]|uniref:DUF4034 domain-containing protein n=1 Tax=Actinacidiphila yanglinensis TaxID=310779 RepID=A0A1H6CXK0_9ACTN|nr:hypothetical protein [Actinacidiphila yanglinensis]SEG77554.1 hypothetical protein SAMN05216223_110246 [Actinacidiphila yanglinensis]
MTPPPPPFRFTRGKNDVAFDPALGDGELVAARAALAQGRWGEVRALLARTGDAWDARGHRLVVLGEGRSSAAWAEEWRLAEPESTDAAALAASAAVFRAIAGKQSPDAARELCLRAARMATSDPTPWLCLLILARRTGSDDEQVRAFDQVRGRHRGHHHAHHLMTQCLVERQKTDGDDPFHEVYEFAEWAAGEAGRTSPLAALPLIALVERYRALAAAGALPGEPDRLPYWSSPRARNSVRAGFDWWLDWDGVGYPRLPIDLNYLAFGKFHTGDTVAAAALFNRIGHNATRVPWSYLDLDPKKTFRAARNYALGFGSGAS